MATVDYVLDIARSQIGVKEHPAGSNCVKYNTAFYDTVVYDGLWGCTFPWCVTFLWWVFRAADASDLFFGGGRTANCGTLADYYAEHGQIVHSYKPGDILFFDFGTGGHGYDHVGLCAAVNKDGTFDVIEGNTSLTSQDNGGSVMLRKRFLLNITCGARINYEDDDMDIKGLLEMLKKASPEERKAVGKELDSCVYEYRVKLDAPGWAEDELKEAMDIGITDGTRPMVYGTRLETAIMCKRSKK